LTAERRVLRDKRGRFVKGTAPGPGRPPKKPVDFGGVPLWELQTLLEASRMFRVINFYNRRGYGPICRFCGNRDPENFLYSYDRKRGRIRYRCKRCGSWAEFAEAHTWFAKVVPVE